MQYLADTFQYVSVKSIGKSYKGADMQVRRIRLIVKIESGSNIIS